jgi:PAS domain S-box-containing protein
MASVEHRYRTLIELAPDPIFLIDPSSTSVVEANGRAAELLGYEQSTLEGMPVIELHPPSQTDAYRSLFEQTVEQGILRTETLPNGERLRLLTQGGAQIPIALHAKTVAVGGDTRVYGIARDISQQREREHQLQEQKERLDEFASVVSHDLRNPLNVADGHLDLARKECDSDHLEEVARSLDRMAELIDDVLGLARAGDQIDELEWVDLTEMSQNCWQNVSTDDVDIVTDTGAAVCADGTRLQQLLENLVRNATEHAGEGATVTVGDLDGGFYIEDDGPGVPPDRREQVFEAGYSSSERGTGLGLSIVKQVVEAHGWEIGITESETGGTRFEITGVDTRR